MFPPIETDRLLIRAPAEGDVDALVRRRNDPEVARLQSWDTPVTEDMAAAIVASAIDQGGPASGEWWMATIATADGMVVGDLAIHPTWEGRTVEIGYTLDRAAWGRGFATEAVEALLTRLFDDPATTRVTGMLHPDNVASARVLERTGFLFEGHTRASYWVGDEVSDDWIYGLTRSDWEAWGDRPRTRPDLVRLHPVDRANERAVYRLRTHKTQEEFVAPMAASFADALFPEVVDGAPVVPRMWAIEADGDIVGFTMIAAVTDHHPEPYLWRLLIDRLHQRRGVGRAALDALTSLLDDEGATSLLTSWAEGRGSPRPFYLAYGFVPTGRIVDDETEARLRLPRQRTNPA